ncbi:hypothetical protein SEENIN0B_01146 [Salmonella enterica subsp. enterica serovar Infantis str. SARB27]|uniref:Uncharacterized protein n=2 Tax=Salmonella infantis TaxID=595 RepID=A0A5Y7AP19_SALIN|nr:hypothetical protein [Salmonella enterica]ECK9504181.1 hypothetical protein [Salmonella enterica subsp. enterica serovar Infantis str. CFSAN000522]EHB41295.1 hypothetical protein SEENIN0B_01146 [Salmonella enterica subsp. enterica serovar Infantis str. SARB27]QCV24277.1 hypothetical protein FE265_05490 [Salmonella enterica subsp. enterica serovar Infantis]QCV28756.1 hypothetical protein FE168_05480 [Salmonella enterica subsp. enterica serovar Infantis]HAE6952221.1 hypothetical protein [Salm
MNNFKNFNIIVWLMFCIAVLVGCGDEDVDSAVSVVEIYHERFNLKDFDYIYKELVSGDFKKTMTKLDYFALMNKNSSVLGSYQYGHLLKTDQVQVLIGENKVKLTYHSTYTNYELNELFVIKLDGGKEKIDQIVYDDIHAIKIKGRTSNL